MQNDLETLEKAGLEHLNGHVRLDETEFGIRVVPITTYAEQCLGESTHYISGSITHTLSVEDCPVWIPPVNEPTKESSDEKLASDERGERVICVRSAEFPFIEVASVEAKPVKKKKKGKGC